jgi:segregation and condensation protein A
MAYQVKINIFEGPLDLLLHLIEKNDLDIYDISISDITAEYLRYLDLLKELNLSVAGEFLVMAATLMQIKAHTILPIEGSGLEEEGPDPRAELMKKLIEYQKFKEAARFLAGGFETQRDIFYRGAPVFSKEDQMLDLNMSNLLEAFKSVLETVDKVVREVLVEEIPVEVRIREILDVLENRPYVGFSELFPKGSTRASLVVTFLALLELIRLKQARVSQPAHFGEIFISRVKDSDLKLESPVSASGTAY